MSRRKAGALGAGHPGSFDAPSAEVIDNVLEQVRETGFCVIESLLPREFTYRVRGILTKLQRIERHRNLQPSGHQRILHLLIKDAIFSELLCHPLVLAIWRRQLGDDMVCSTMTANALLPGSTEQYWHADYPYWTMQQPYPVFPLSGQVIWMIDAFTEENGGTAGIAGSHRRGHLPDMGRDWCDDATILTGSPGSAVIADGAWWHTSRPNRSRRTRYAVLASYIRSYCVTQEDMSMQLAAIPEPSPLVQQLLGARRYVPTRGFPY
ncbi:phytanoyl-CoA dioxygenase family protein [Burkholderia thailandensis]|uniref:phytanoyl-CoA dioxygenase family protein n=1 Tax=Burkholderia thailandensis TaxID=57975 RepID=UPI001ED9538B|nr:phytanoyl-CoA dioxygenase family protein [Burkholderia thailandensis]MCS3394002.1 phytanoyl-CoA dioxygenase family protein [Burkholderia thailandensis]MCS6426950.1 phytanoyl-CoA dioxygenase family protein [Burkholderia thailandensis]MCS6455375.1 phytanoyl-CoA dioxygenase family protein [Burkholderia thailandensis]MCS6465968.1 phytanoyl-CoA dioxygenase family protein [Burkholderia thailandensis]MCS6484845.1 phytanoyl-CoA dioxygenase family protein [Burkholderia thailandensis]